MLFLLSEWNWIVEEVKVVHRGDRQQNCYYYYYSSSSWWLEGESQSGNVLVSESTGRELGDIYLLVVQLSCRPQTCPTTDNAPSFDQPNPPPRICSTFQRDALKRWLQFQVPIEDKASCKGCRKEKQRKITTCVKHSQQFYENCILPVIHKCPSHLHHFLQTCLISFQTLCIFE